MKFLDPNKFCSQEFPRIVRKNRLNLRFVFIMAVMDYSLRKIVIAKSLTLCTQFK